MDRSKLELVSCERLDRVLCRLHRIQRILAEVLHLRQTEGFVPSIRNPLSSVDLRHLYRARVPCHPLEILGGPIFAVAGAGESHGPAVTTIVLGCPAGQYVCRKRVQEFLDRRRPGSNRHGTPRQEKDKVVFLSGLYQDDTEKLLTGSGVTVALGWT